jgi:parallel beta-helix repeat protein
MGKANKKLPFMVLLIFSVFSVSVKATDIYSCTEINQPGYYKLADNIFAEESECLYINGVDGVIIDGNNKFIYGRIDVERLIYVHHSRNVLIKNIVLDTAISGLEIDYSYWTYFENSKIINTEEALTGDYSYGITVKNSMVSVADTCVELQTTSYSYFLNNVLSDCEIEGVFLFDVKESTFYGNFISSNEYLLAVENCSRLSIYNNYFMSYSPYPYDVSVMRTYNSEWNVPMQIGRAITGGPFIAGNFWGNYRGKGVSQMCSDLNPVDGLCDTANKVLGKGNVDRKPLAVWRPEMKIITGIVS